MQAHEDIDMQLWDYLDGNCDEQQQAHISKLIQSDKAWQERYRDLCALQGEIPELVEQEEPSVRFTKNVMDVIATTEIARPTKKYINQYAIRAIAACLILCVCITLAYTLLQTKWSEPGTNFSIPFKLNQLKQYDATLVNAVIAVNILLALVLVDTFLRKRRKSQIQ